MLLDNKSVGLPICRLHRRHFVCSLLCQSRPGNQSPFVREVIVAGELSLLLTTGGDDISAQCCYFATFILLFHLDLLAFAVAACTSITMYAYVRIVIACKTKGAEQISKCSSVRPASKPVDHTFSILYPARGSPTVISADRIPPPLIRSAFPLANCHFNMTPTAAIPNVSSQILRLVAVRVLPHSLHDGKGWTGRVDDSQTGSLDRSMEPTLNKTAEHSILPGCVFCLR